MWNKISSGPLPQIRNTPTGSLSDDKKNHCSNTRPPLNPRSEDQTNHPLLDDPAEQVLDQLPQKLCITTTAQVLTDHKKPESGCPPSAQKKTLSDLRSQRHTLFL